MQPCRVYAEVKPRRGRGLLHGLSVLRGQQRPWRVCDTNEISVPVEAPNGRACCQRQGQGGSQARLHCPIGVGFTPRICEFRLGKDSVIFGGLLIVGSPCLWKMETTVNV